MARIFISHSSKDNLEALAFQQWLVSKGWSGDDVFLDLHGIGAGARWKDALARANERCEAVLLLASPASLASTECRIEIRMAEDYGKEIIVAILYLLTVESEELGVYADRQIVDLSLEPCEAIFTVEHEGQQKTVTFNRQTLANIKARLDQLGISPTSFSWRPGDLQTASPYPGLEGFGRDEAALFFGRAGDISRGLAKLRKLRHAGRGQILVVQAASGAGKSSYLKAGLWPRLERDTDFTPVAILRPATGSLSRTFMPWIAARLNHGDRHTCFTHCNKSMFDQRSCNSLSLVVWVNSKNIDLSHLVFGMQPQAYESDNKLFCTADPYIVWLCFEQLLYVSGLPRSPAVRVKRLVYIVLHRRFQFIEHGLPSTHAQFNDPT